MIQEYRVWDNLNKVYEVPINIMMDANGVINTVNTSHGKLTDGNFVLEQYTGLKDKHGNKIFEGDILHTDSEINYVTFQDFGFSTHNSQALVNYVFDTVTGTPKYNDKFFRVIGNIHQNPEITLGKGY